MEKVIAGFHIKKGITQKQVSDLIDYSSRDKLIRKFTTDGVRFKDKASFDAWEKKRRTLYTLCDSSEKLAGIIWFGSKKMPSGKLYLNDFDKKHYGLTFAIRLYKKARGLGISLPFMKDAFADFIKSDKYKKSVARGFWLETYSNNIQAIRAYKGFGYKRVSDPDGNNRIIMVFDR